MSALPVLDFVCCVLRARVSVITVCVRDRGAFAICRLGHKQGEPDVKVAVKSLFRNHPQFDPEGITHEISVMKVDPAFHADCA